MPTTPFEEVWRRIVALEGRTFRTKTGLEFTYTVEGNGLCTDRTDYRLTKRNFEDAYQLAPFEGPGDVAKLVRGPSYVWAILHDGRVSRGEW